MFLCSRIARFVFEAVAVRVGENPDFSVVTECNEFAVLAIIEVVDVVNSTGNSRAENPAKTSAPARDW